MLTICSFRGAGTAGIAAAQALSNQSITDFIIVEYNGNIGGRMKTFEFGEKPDGSGPYTLELGANWGKCAHGPAFYHVR
jgi:polyamine oxidase